jgi:hypothetical protein
MKRLRWSIPLFFLLGCYKSPTADYIDEMPAANNTSMLKTDEPAQKNEMPIPGMNAPQQMR